MLRDLVVPWLISAACIAVFFVVVFWVGLLAWPVCFLIFLWLCVLRRNDAAARTDIDPQRGADAAP